MDEPKSAGSVPVDTEQPKDQKGTTEAVEVLASPIERLEGTLDQFEVLCMNGAGQNFRSRLKSKIGPRLHTMLARLGSLS